MSSATFIVGDVREVLAAMPDASVDLVLTSPPFLALRSYLPADHPDKGKEIGSEATPADFLDTLLDLTVEWRRVLTPHGSLCVELGDTYSGSGGAGGDYSEGGMRDGQPMFRQGYVRNDRPNRPPQESPKAYGNGGPRPPRAGRSKYADNVERGRITDHDSGRRTPAPGWPLDKSLCGIPELYRLSLAYGRNILRPERTIEPWRVRNVIRWCRPNPPVGALGDKFRPGTSDMVVACTSRTRWFDLDAVRVPFTGHPGVGTGVRKGQNGDKPEDNRPDDLPTRKNTHDGAPPLDWWKISTEPYKGSHYATWPTALLTRPIQAMCPREVCTVCGEPSRRVVDVERIAAADDAQRKTKASAYRLNGHNHPPEVGWEMSHKTVGWSDCGHNSWRPGVVLDPFAGSGTTLAVATGHGRDAIGIDLDARNTLLAEERIGRMFLTVLTLAECAAQAVSA